MKKNERTNNTTEEKRIMKKRDTIIDGTNVSYIMYNASKYGKYTYKDRITGTKCYSDVKKYYTENPVYHQMNDMLSRTKLALDLLDDSRYYISSILGIDIHMDRVLHAIDFAEAVRNYGFDVSNIRDMLRHIKAFMYYNGLHLIDIDIRDSDVISKCIYLECWITFRKKWKWRDAFVELHYCDDNTIKFVYCSIVEDGERIDIDTIDELKKVIGELEK